MLRRSMMDIWVLLVTSVFSSTGSGWLHNYNLDNAWRTAIENAFSSSSQPETDAICEDSSVDEGSARLMCFIMALPGKWDGPCVEVYKQKWDAQLNSFGDEIFGASVATKDRLKDAEELCANVPTNQDDQKCLFLRLSQIGNALEGDLTHLKDKVGNGTGKKWYLYATLLSAWYLDWAMISLDCQVEAEEWLWEFFALLSKTESRSQLCYLSTTFRKDVARALREKVQFVCHRSFNEPLCRMKPMLEAIDSIENFCEQVKSDPWNQSSNEVSALSLVFYALRILPHNKQSTNFPQTDDIIRRSVAKLLNLFFDEILTKNFSSIEKVLKILPSSFSLQCEPSSKYPEFEWIICSLSNVIDQLRTYINMHGIGNGGKLRRRKVIPANFDYPSYLSNLKVDEILQLSQGTKTDLLIVATYLQNSIQDRFKELGSFYKSMSEFDQKISEADIGYINGRLQEYQDADNIHSSNLAGEMDSLFTACLVGVAGDLVEAIVKMAIRVAKAGNPLKWIFDSGNADDIQESLGEISQASAALTKAISNQNSWNKLLEKSTEMQQKFLENKDFLEDVRILVTNTQDDAKQSNTFEEAKKEFLQKYEVYSPSVRKDELAELLSLWELVVDDVCACIDDAGGITAGVSKAISYSQGECKRAKVYVQQLIATQEEIYDFQFDLMDAMADYMRAQTQLQAANMIGASTEEDYSAGLHIDDLKIMAAVSTVSFRVTQFTAVETYCDLLEYKLGRRPSDCTGLSTDISRLTSLTIKECDETLKYVSVPARPSGSLDRAWLNLQDLYSGRSVQFQVPNNQWLLEHNWITPDEAGFVFHVHGLEVYMPVSSASGQTVSVTVTPGNVGNKLAVGDDEPEYVITPNYSIRFQYTEGFGGPCRTDKIDNPYHVCGHDDDKRLEPICIHSVGKADEKMLYPSIYSRYKINVIGYQDEGLSAPVTNLSVLIGMRLCAVNPEVRKREYSEERSGLHLQIHERESAIEDIVNDISGPESNKRTQSINQNDQVIAGLEDLAGSSNYAEFGLGFDSQPAERYQRLVKGLNRQHRGQLNAMKATKDQLLHESSKELRESTITHRHPEDQSPDNSKQHELDLNQYSSRELVAILQLLRSLKDDVGHKGGLEGGEKSKFRREYLCCDGEQEYEDKELGQCNTCPPGTISRYHGLFCGDVVKWKEDTPSLSEARKSCTDAGTTIASPDELQKARNLGSTECRCGWLSDGSVDSARARSDCELKTMCSTSMQGIGVYCSVKYN